MYCFSINIVCRLFVPSAFGFYQLYSRDRFTHGAQARRNRGGLGMAVDFEPWDFFYRSWYKARLPDCWVECLWRFPSYNLDHLGIFGAKYCTQWPRHYITNGHIFSSNATWCTFPDTREFHLQCSPPRSLLITGGPSDPLQDLYSLQQNQGVIHWRDSNLGNLQMSWPRTLFLRLSGNWEWSLRTADYWRHHFEIPLVHGHHPFHNVPIETTSPADEPSLTTRLHELAKDLSDTLKAATASGELNETWAMVERMSFHDAIEVLLQAPNFSSEWSDRPYVH